MHECYIKQVFGECWDTFQIRVVEVGGNKRFFDFLAYYNKEREDIPVKYCSSPALYYRRMLTSWVLGKNFDEDRPAKNWTEFVVKKNEAYQISDKASTVYESARTGLSSFWTKITTSATEETADAQALGNQAAQQWPNNYNPCQSARSISDNFFQDLIAKTFRSAQSRQDQVKKVGDLHKLQT